MHSFFSFFSLATVLSSVVASPIAGPEPKPDAKAEDLNTLIKRGHFSLKQKSVQRTRPWIAPQRIRRTYMKYGAQLPDGLNEAAEAAIAAVENGTASVVAIPEKNDIEYLSPINIGGRELMVDIDTGSADLWVFSSHLPAQQRARHSFYNPGTTAKVMANHKWNITYGDGSYASGVVYVDRVAIGPVTATAQAVEAATKVSEAFLYDDANDGLLGLAFTKLNRVEPTRQKTFFDNVKDNLAAPVFTAMLKKAQPGTYDFGYIDQSKYQGEITYVPVSTASGHWAFRIDGFAIGSGQRLASRSVAVPDTGSSLWYIPMTVARQYWAQVRTASYNRRAGGWVIDCAEQLPDMKVYIGGKEFVVPGNYMVYARVGTIVETGKPACLGGIQSDDGLPYSIFGDVFLKTVFAIYDYGKGEGQQRMGFAKQAA